MLLRHYRYEKELAEFRRRGGVLRTNEALRAGVHPRVFYAMRDAGLIEPLSRGVYRLTELPPLGNPDLVTVQLRVPEAVICLVSALAFHEITTQIPHEVQIALRRPAREPQLPYPPLHTFWFSGKTYTAGIETHQTDDISLKVYSPEKTLADCFRYRKKLGLEVVLEALRLYRERKSIRVAKLLEYARICRVEKVMRPYLEALL
jgi:predicted transcriptional regulator of viral defense system